MWPPVFLQCRKLHLPQFPASVNTREQRGMCFPSTLQVLREGWKGKPTPYCSPVITIRAVTEKIISTRGKERRTLPLAPGQYKEEPPPPPEASRYFYFPSPSAALHAFLSLLPLLLPLAFSSLFESSFYSVADTYHFWREFWQRTESDPLPFPHLPAEAKPNMPFCTVPPRRRGAFSCSSSPACRVVWN